MKSVTIVPLTAAPPENPCHRSTGERGRAIDIPFPRWARSRTLTIVRNGRRERKPRRPGLVKANAEFVNLAVRRSVPLMSSKLSGFRRILRPNIRFLSVTDDRAVQFSPSGFLYSFGEWASIARSQLDGRDIAAAAGARPRDGDQPTLVESGDRRTLAGLTPPAEYPFPAQRKDRSALCRTEQPADP